MNARPLKRPFDVGLQTERTALSWQRTTLAFALGFLLAARLLVTVLGSLSFFLVAGGLILMAGLFLLGYWRYRSAHNILVTSAGERVSLTSALPLFAWALVVFCLAMGGLVLALIAAVGGVAA